MVNELSLFVLTWCRRTSSFRGPEKRLQVGDPYHWRPQSCCSFLGEGDPLADFLGSLKKVENLMVDKVLRVIDAIFADCRGRIRELIEHHQRERGGFCGYCRTLCNRISLVAARMTWDMVYRDWTEGCAG